jgi:putative hydrolase of the HAD superfamily
LAISVLIFDLDDTLYPELDYVRSGFKAVAEGLQHRLGLAAGATLAELEEAFLEDPSPGVFDRWLERHRLDPGGMLDYMVSTYRLHHPRLQLFADARWALTDLRLTHRLALLTDGRPNAQRNKLRALGIEGCFERILITDDLGAACRKPGTLGFELLLADLGEAAQGAMYIGDNPAKDFLGPRRLGMTTVRVRRPCGLYRDLEAATPEHAPDVEVDSLFPLALLLA